MINCKTCYFFHDGFPFLYKMCYHYRDDSKIVHYYAIYNHLKFSYHIIAWKYKKIYGIKLVLIKMKKRQKAVDILYTAMVR